MAGTGAIPPPLLREAGYRNIIENKNLRVSRFRDAELRGCEPCLDGHGDALMYSGGWAAVFKVKSGNNYLGLRFFHSHYIPAIQKRLTMISRFVKIARYGLPFLVNFSFLPRGMSGSADSHGVSCSYPLVKMPWIEGESLYDYIDAHVSQPDKMAALAEKLIILFRLMSVAGISHGDLQPENILVDRNEDLKLVDYDGMYVPAMKRLGLQNLVDGVPGYQPKSPRKLYAYTIKHSCNLYLRVDKVPS
jgi:hypothetical protein